MKIKTAEINDQDACINDVQRFFNEYGHKF